MRGEPYDTPQDALDAHHDEAGNLPVMRARFENNGSPRYVLYTIKKFGLDRSNDFYLDVQLVADDIEGDKETVEVKLQNGDADLIDIDYLSTARERATGAPVTAFYPYGRTVGGLVVPAESPIQGLEDLRGHRVGVVRRLDKNWILTRAACRQFHGFDPEDDVTLVEAGSKTGLEQRLKAGEIDAALQFWQLIPQLTATGEYREVLPVADLVQRLAGTSDPIPMAAFLTTDRYLANHPETVDGFTHAYRTAVSRLKRDDELWTELGANMMDDANPAIVASVRDGWRDMVVTDWNEDTIDGLGRLFDHLLDVVGADSLGVDRLPEGTFTLEVQP